MSAVGTFKTSRDVQLEAAAAEDNEVVGIGDDVSMERRYAVQGGRRQGT
jgi:hypothetical protein